MTLLSSFVTLFFFFFSFFESSVVLSQYALWGESYEGFTVVPSVITNFFPDFASCFLAFKQHEFSTRARFMYNQGLYLIFFFAKVESNGDFQLCFPSAVILRPIYIISLFLRLFVWGFLVGRCRMVCLQGRC